METQFAVKSYTQKVLFFIELQGQLSDGQYENTRPLDHWKVWCSLNWEDVIVDEENPGRTFYAVKDNYSFGGLLDIVGDRILAKINQVLMIEGAAAIVEDGNHWDLPEGKGDLTRWAQQAAKGSEYWQAKMQRLLDAGYSEQLVEQILDNPVYTEKDMRRDLAEIKKAMKTRRA